MLCGFDILIVIISRGIVFKVPKFTFDVVKSVYIYMYAVQCIIVWKWMLFMYVYVAWSYT